MMNIQIENTPNPETKKFLISRVLHEGDPIFYEKGDTLNSSLAQRLMHLRGVKSLLIGQDFVAITKEPDESFEGLVPLIQACLEDHLERDAGIEDHAASSTSHVKNDDPIALQIQELLDTRVRPGVALDGGDIVFVKFEKGIVYVKLKGACSGCPSSSLTLKAGIESLLKHYVPEVQEVIEA